jgi:hypothetical protein
VQVLRRGKKGRLDSQNRVLRKTSQWVGSLPGALLVDPDSRVVIPRSCRRRLSSLVVVITLLLVLFVALVLVFIVIAILVTHVGVHSLLGPYPSATCTHNYL